MRGFRENVTGGGFGHIVGHGRQNPVIIRIVEEQPNVT
jgi:hypothetical protein